MKPFRICGIFLWGLAALWLVLLTFLSSQPGGDTARASSLLARFLLRLLHLHESRLDALHAGLRTAAHFAGFFVLGALLYAAMGMTASKAENLHFWAAGICGAIGIFDEVKKVFIRGRHLSPEEAMLNVIGALCGIIAVMVITGLAASGAQAPGSPPAGSYRPR